MKKLFTLLLMCVAFITVSAQEGVTYTLKTLTFEDNDYVGGTANYLGNDTSYWSSLIDNPQYGGSLLYGENHGDTAHVYTSVNYQWYDKDNTFLASALPENWGTHMYWGGGHAISNYWDGNLNNGDYEHQLSVCVPGTTLNGTNGHGHNGSNNFCVHYGYHDNSGYSAENLPYFYFGDSIARTIDHMYVNLTTYLANCILNGNTLTSVLGINDYLKIVANGFVNNEFVGSQEFYIANTGGRVISDWSIWNLSELEDVDKVQFNIVGSNDNGYGLSQPAYFAYDNVAVRFTTDLNCAKISSLNKVQESDESQQLSFVITPNYNRSKKVFSANLSGNVPEGVSATFESTQKSSFLLNDADQSSKISISGLKGVIIKGISANVHASERGGAGYMTVKDGDDQFGYMAFCGEGMGAELGQSTAYGTVVGANSTNVPFTLSSTEHSCKDDIIINSSNVNITEDATLNTSITINSYTIVYEKDTTTSIDQIVTGSAEDESIYTLQGVRVTNPVKGGIYIKKGKKFVNK